MTQIPKVPYRRKSAQRNMALISTSLSTMANAHPRDYHAEKPSGQKIKSRLVQGIAEEKSLILDVKSKPLSSMSIKKRKDLLRDESDNYKTRCIKVADSVLDEAANDVGEEPDWEQILEQWKTESESIPFEIISESKELQN
jgi:hypothetical protein